jgi:hydrogenase-1 operon protein HyaF
VSRRDYPRIFAPSDALRAWLARLTDSLAMAASAGVDHQRLDLNSLDAESIQAAEEILGSGEVEGAVTLDGVEYRVEESVLAGIWQIRGNNGDHWIEVAAIPQIMEQAALSLAKAPFAVPAEAPYVMNAPAVLAEISDRAARWDGAQNHVVNFTLMPMSEGDHDLLLEVLGRASLTLESGGFGNCRVMATRYRHVWAVQYLNALGHIILDTLEIGDVPDAIRAATSDFEDSAIRLREILETYLQ